MDIASNPHSVEEIFKDYNSRRNAIVRALTYGKFPPLCMFICEKREGEGGGEKQRERGVVCVFIMGFSMVCPRAHNSP